MNDPNVCSPLPRRELALPMTRPKRESDDQADARTAADQQAAAVEFQCAYWALSARRSILPVPRRGNGSSEKMIRSGILNLRDPPVEECAELGFGQRRIFA